MKILSTLLAALTAASLAAAAAPSAVDLPKLVDQFGGPVSLDAAGRVQVAIVVSAKKLRRIKPWEKALRDEFPDLSIVRVADVPTTTPTNYNRVAATLRKRLPEDVAVGIDLDGQWAAALGLDTSIPNVLVFDASGQLTHQQSGMFRKSMYPSLQSALLDVAAGRVAATGFRRAPVDPHLRNPVCAQPREQRGAEQRT